MAAFNQDQGRANAGARRNQTARSEGANGFVSHNPRSAEEREADIQKLADEHKVSRMCFK